MEQVLQSQIHYCKLHKNGAGEFCVTLAVDYNGINIEVEVEVTIAEA